MLKSFVRGGAGTLFHSNIALVGFRLKKKEKRGGNNDARARARARAHTHTHTRARAHTHTHTHTVINSLVQSSCPFTDSYIFKLASVEEREKQKQNKNLGSLLVWYFIGVAFHQWLFIRVVAFHHVAFHQGGFTPGLIFHQAGGLT